MDDPDLTFERPPHPNAFKAILRSVLNRVGGCGMAVATLGHSFFRAPFDVEYNEIEMPLRGLGAGLNGFRIVQVTDLHTARGTPVWFLRQVMQRVNDLPHDLVAITGDFISHGRKHVHKACAVCGLLRGPVVGVFGNHDYSGTWETWASQEVAEMLVAGLRPHGIRILRNEAVPIERDGARAWIAGLEDFWSDRFSPRQAFAGIPPGEPVIALSHNADSVFALERAGAQWILAGHTHGGQIRLPGMGGLMVPQKHKELDMGLFTVGNSRMYVSRGVGFRVRARFRCRPEVTTFILRDADQMKL